MSLSLYIAAPWPLQWLARSVRRDLTAEGFSVLARWIDKAEEVDANDTARLDLDDITASDALVLVNPSAWAKRGTGGRHVETGYALAAGKPVYIFGARTNVFHHLTEVVVCQTVTELAQKLRDSLPRPETDSRLDLARRGIAAGARVAFDGQGFDGLGTVVSVSPFGYVRVRFDDDPPGALAYYTPGTAARRLVPVEEEPSV